MSALVLRSGMVARFDGLRGLIPCRVVAITGTSGQCSTEQRVTVMFTREAGGFRRGETFQCFALHVVPVAAVMRRRYSTRLRSYLVECDINQGRE